MQQVSKTGLALLLLSLGACVQGKIHHSFLDKDDRPLIPLAEPFGFADGKRGKIDIKISNVAIWSKHDDDTEPNLDHFGLFLSPVEADPALEPEFLTTYGERCILTDLPKNASITFRDSGMQDLIRKKKDEFTFHYEVERGGLFSLYFANCEPEMPISMEAVVSLYNIDDDGNKDYLSLGETELEEVYWVMFALFTVMTGLWSWYVWNNRQYAHRIHLLMGLLCAFKALTVMTQAGMYHFIERTGSADGWNIAYYIFTFFRGVLFFTVVVLIGTGWSYMKPFLGDKEKRILMVVIPLQVFANIAIIITDEEAPSVRDWFTWRDMFHLVDIICCCAILFPIVWSIKHLREASHADGKAARNLEKLTLFRQFYVMVVVYIYFTRIVVYLLRSTTQYEYAWISAAAENFATLGFYIWTAIKFRPQPNNPYLKLEQQETELEL